MNTEKFAYLDVDVLYRERIALNGEHLVSVHLDDVSRLDVLPRPIASQSLLTDQSVPFSFRLRFDPCMIDPRFTYRVSARIEHEGRLLYGTTVAHDVDLSQRQTQPMTVIMQRINSN
ncbi:YbaY family lipoprotein [Pseudomonas sp. B21-032]|uniref:YbaY family lipoprotein n=1 Tax=Pseudomonas sp. B21-032 TaxID=2895483 RepID=UPI0021602D1D|nr:YbaY family lipoprotein [Pseudomonas sp. B21-032]UVL62783.1 YbaY family lipoprotein [Pseudomonas sp. B21-032]